MIINKASAYIKKLLNSDFVKVSLLNSLSLGVRTVTGFISIKFVAVIIGPPGLALLGQLNNFSSFIMAFSSPGINSGVTKFVVDNEGEPAELRKYISTGLSMLAILSLTIGGGLIIFSSWLSNFIFYSDKYNYVIIILGASLFFYNLNTLIFGIINGFKEYKSYVNISIWNTILGLLLTLTLVHYLKIAGALIAVVISQSFVLFLTLFMVRKKAWLQLSYFTGGLRWDICKKYSNYIVMAIVSGGVGPLSLFLTRSAIIQKMGIDSAGIWDAMYRFSYSLLQIIVMSLGVYYFPKAAEIKDKSLLHKFIWDHIKMIVPVAMCCYLILFLLRNIIIRILFAKTFAVMNSLFLMQFVGDSLKIAVWFYAYAMSAQMLTKYFVINEILSGVLLPLLTYLLLNAFGLTSVTIAYATTNAISILFLLCIFKFRISKKQTFNLT